MTTRIIKIARTIRSNWKKSLVGAIALSYAINYTSDYAKIQDLMRVYCEKAIELGHQTIPVEKDVVRQVTVILNPKANNRKAEDEFEKYCAPLLHLAGISVDIIKTEAEGHAKDLINSLTNTDAIVVAGGDGTLSEVITGLLRRTQENNIGLLPIGVLPLGRTNSLANNLFTNPSNKVEKVKTLANATMAVVEEIVKPIDVMRIEIIDEDNNDNNNNNNNNSNKPIYGVGSIKWGAYRDAEQRKDKYWYWGKFRNYVTYIFNGFKKDLNWRCECRIKYSPPCTGCNNCMKVNQPKKWFERLNNQPSHLSNIINPACKLVNTLNISTVDFNLFTPNLVKNSGDNIPKLLIKIGPPTVDYWEFVQTGIKFSKGEEKEAAQIIEARQVEIRPKQLTNETYFSIDNENFELKPIRVSILPKFINVFIKQNQ